MNSIAQAHRAATPRTPEDAEIEALLKQLPPAPTHAASVQKADADVLEPAVAGTFAAQQARKMTTKQFQHYKQALDVMRAPGLLKRDALVAATRIATGQEALPALIGSNPLRVKDPFELAVAVGLLDNARKEAETTASTLPAEAHAAESGIVAAVPEPMSDDDKAILEALHKNDVQALRKSMGAAKLHQLVWYHGGITPEIVGLLRELGGAKHDFSPLAASAALRGDLASVKALLETGAVVNYERYDHDTLLHKAAANGHADLIFYLLSRGHDANAGYNRPWTYTVAVPSSTKVTPLSQAVIHGHTTAARLLLTHTKLNKATLRVLQDQAGATGTQEMRDLLKDAKVTPGLFGY